jgi:hypothetical protein
MKPGSDGKPSSVHSHDVFTCIVEGSNIRIVTAAELTSVNFMVQILGGAWQDNEYTAVKGTLTNFERVVL